jgi:hypothetical protein
MSAYARHPRHALLDEVLNNARVLSRIGLPIARALSDQMRAAVALHRGDRRAALEFAQSAERCHAAEAVAVYEIYMRRARGLILAGPEGKALLDETADTLRAQGIKDVDRWTAMKLPGFG